MRILNLARPEISDIKFEISRFPDGQQDITITSIMRARDPLNEWEGKEDIEIRSRFSNFKDLELILAATAALKRLNVRYVGLYVPYILGARSDRQFKTGGTSYLLDVIAPILNSQGYRQITVLDPHSDVMGAIHNLRIVDNYQLVSYALLDIYQGTLPIDKFVLVSPDGGSLKKIYKIADRLSYKGDVICCSKLRDTEGKLTRTTVPVLPEHKDKDFVIIDDICDGGRTFINIVNELRAQDFQGKVYLIVSHGIFSAGFNSLNIAFEGIFSTTSVLEEWIPKDVSQAEARNLKLLEIF